MISAPAAAWLDAVSPSRGRVSSFKTFSPRTRPQWPWLVYSQRHRSVITTRLVFSLIAAIALWITPWES